MSDLSGLRVVVTREKLGELGSLLEGRGAIVIHCPLIAIEPPEDGGLSLRRQLDMLDEFDWLVVTSVAGAERVGDAAARAPDVRLAAVGATSARTLTALASRAVDLIPAVQTASALAVELIGVSGDQQHRFLVAQADIAAETLVEDLRTAGHEVKSCVAYKTTLRPPEINAIEGADALLFASGSAAQSWVDAVGTESPGIVVAIGPSTAQTATELGLKVSGVAADHTLEGLVTELERQLSARRTDVGSQEDPARQE